MIEACRQIAWLKRARHEAVELCRPPRRVTLRTPFVLAFVTNFRNLFCIFEEVRKVGRKGRGSKPESVSRNLVGSSSYARSLARSVDECGTEMERKLSHVERVVAGRPEARQVARSFQVCLLSSR